MYNKPQKILSAIICIILVVLISVWTSRCLFPHPYADIIAKYCNQYDVDENLVFALIKAESNFKQDAVSHAEAKGIMQITDETFIFCMENTKLKNENIFDIDTNIHAGVWYLSFLSEKYKGNMANALAAYNAGMGNVDRWLCDERYSYDGENLKNIPFAETKQYIEKIKRYKTIYKILY